MHTVNNNKNKRERIWREEEEKNLKLISSHIERSILRHNFTSNKITPSNESLNTITIEKKTCSYI